MDANQKPKATQKSAASPAVKAAKKTAAKKSEASPKVKAAKKSATAAPHIDHIARAAYLNYRKRVEQGLPGDTDSDWLLAEQQLSQASTPSS